MEDWKHCPQFAPLADLIRSHGSFAVIAHVHPDGDAIGSTLALGEALKQMGKKVVMMNEDGVPSNLAFMPGVENIIPTPDEPVDVEVAISVDNGALKRLGERSLEALAGVKVWANIDHHRTNELFGDVQCVLPDECATGAVLYYFFKYLGVPVTPVMRDALYVAVSTDTGSFQYQMTTAAVMELAADLIRMGVDVQDINRQLYQEKPWVKMQLMREALNGMKLTDKVSINGYTVTASFSCTDQSQPSQYVRALIDQGYFENINYTGYSVEKATGENADKKESITFKLTMLLKAGNDLKLDKDEANSAIENLNNQGSESDASAGENGSDTSSSAE